MARLKLELPPTFSFYTKMAVRITDLNYGGHVGNDTILSFLHEARAAYLKSLGYTELNIEGVSLIMSDVAIEFKSEVFYGDIVKAYVAAAEPSKVGFDLYYRLVKGDDEKPVALAKTGMVCFDYKNKKPVPLSEPAKRVFGF